ncbi:hypothetical protein L1987_13007 [Smallanthus sonchifolius]|uniref:Uncharacterized protein n=1 Tax=Smallanthus sonchifolius TaxID=185202 RepID=A0ACB9JGC1_9ASTR|nr:hypothetical protein L1987_13007 [Smallanthus sonchifolius]
MSRRGRGGRGNINMTTTELTTLINEHVAEAVAASQAAHNAARQQTCTFKTFMECKPHTYSGAEGAVSLLRWFEKIERYIDDLIPQIQSTVTSSNPTTIQQIIRLAHRLTDQVVTQGTLPPRGIVTKATDSNKRKFDSNTNTKSFQSNPPQQQQRRFEPTKTFNQSTSSSQNQGNYAGKYPKCNKCGFHHNGACDKHRCQRCGKMGHAAKDCRGELQPKQPFQQQGPTRGCYECGKEGHFRKDCPQLKKNGNGNANGNGNNQGNNGNNNGNGAKGRAFVIGSGEARNDHNVVIGKFLLNECFAFVLFDTCADRNFISIRN